MEVAQKILGGESVELQNVVHMAKLKGLEATDHWAKVFLYHKVPVYSLDIIKAKTKKIEASKVSIFNTNNVNWWISVTLKQLLDAKVVHEDGDKLVWNDRGAVVCIDETGISKNSQKRTGKTKLAAKSKVDSHNQLPEVYIKDCTKHITCIAGSTVSGDPVMPCWILPRKNKIEPKDMVKFKSIISDSADYGSMAGCEYKDKMIKHTKSGSVDSIILQDYLTKLVKILRKKVPHERIVFLCDWHSSRMSLKLSQKLEELNAMMLFWLPRCTSVMQPADISMYGPFKQTFRKVKSIYKTELLADGVTTKTSLNVEETLQCANKALVETYNSRSIIKKGLLMSGMFDLDFRPLLGLTEIELGDKHKEAMDKNIAWSYDKELFSILKDPNCNSEDFKNTLLNRFEKTNWPMGVESAALMNGEGNEELFADTHKILEENEVQNLQKLDQIREGIAHFHRFESTLREFANVSAYSSMGTLKDTAYYHYRARMLPDMIDGVLNAMDQFEKHIKLPENRSFKPQKRQTNLMMASGTNLVNIVQRSVDIDAQRAKKKRKPKVKKIRSVDAEEVGHDNETHTDSRKRKRKYDPETYIMEYNDFECFHNALKTDREAPSNADFEKYVENRVKSATTTKMQSCYEYMQESQKTDGEASFYRSLFHQVHKEKKSYSNVNDYIL